MTTQQPEALRLADELCEAIAEYPEPTALEAQAAAELRRQHARITELESQLAQRFDAADLPEALRSIQRFEVVDCIDEKHVPAVIPKPHGPWVRYEDHIAALAAGQATAAPAQPSAPQGVAQQEAHHLAQALTDRENQPNQYGVEFGMSGTYMHFKIGNQLFKLAYEPDEQEEFDFMKRMLVNAFTTFTHDVKTAHGDALSDAVRVPLNSLHADAAYLIGRLREGSMPYDRVIEIIRERIDAAFLTAQADSVQEDAARYRWLRERSSTMFVNISINGEGAEIAATLDSAVDTARAAQKEGE